jgi:glutamate 5-kinase
MEETQYHRIVIKVGTSTLTGGGKHISPALVLDIVRQIVHLQSDGCQVILVTSGAIAAGREALDYPDLPKHIPAKQMMAAVGQPRLMELYAQLFRIYNLVVSQVLLTRADLGRRRGYLNARNTLDALFSQKIVPIVNENDAVATEEIRVGDNDNLSALVANLVEADLLVLLTDQDGLYTSDPRMDPSAQMIHEITSPEIPDEVWQAAGGTGSGLGTGGMITKIRAADLARRSGTTVVIASGAEPDALNRLAQGERLGTWFLANEVLGESRKRFILAGLKTSRGVIKIDSGAAHALKNGTSLLPVGVISVKGKFERGDTVRIVDSDNHEVAVGITNYDSEDTASLCRKKSEEIEALLGYTFGDEIVHRNNLVIL